MKLRSGFILIVLIFWSTPSIKFQYADKVFWVFLIVPQIYNPHPHYGKYKVIGGEGGSMSTKTRGGGGGGGYNGKNRFFTKQLKLSKPKEA